MQQILVQFSTFLLIITFSSSMAQNEALKIKKLHNLAVQKMEINQLDSAIYFEQKVFFLAKQTKKDQLITDSHATLGLIYKLKGKYPQALFHLFKALHQYELSKNKSGVLMQLGNIGTVYDMQADFPKALDYYQRSLNLAIEIKDQKSISNQYTNVATIQAISSDFVAAEVNYKKALAIDSTLKNEQSYAKNLMNLASLYSELGNPQKSLVPYFKALSLFQKVNSKIGEANALLNISASYTELKQEKNAKDYLNLAFEASKNLEDQGFKVFLESIASQIYADFGDYDNAFDHYKKHILIRDELYNAENTKRSIEAELNYNFEKKKLRNQLIQQKAVDQLNAKNRFFRSVLIFSIVFGVLTLLLLFLWMRFKTNKKQLSLKEFHSRQLLLSQEKERHRIARDLHDSIGQNVLFIRNQLIKTDQTNLLPAVDETLNEIRAISKDLFPSQLEAYGLKAAVESLFEKAQESTSLFISMDLDDFPQTIDQETQINLFRIIQECLSNAIKHANATAFRLTVELNLQSIVLLIQDNGVGFNQQILVEKAQKSMGMLNLTERIKILKGKFELETEPNKGTKLRFILPVNQYKA